MASRTATITRTTKETDILLTLEIDGTGKTDIDTGIPFFDHMLDAFARHGLFDLTVKAKGDLEVDAHHTVEDVGIVLGQALTEAMMGLFDSSLAKEFFIAFATNAHITLHLVSFKGENAHHLIEAAFKATGRVLRQALEIDPRAADQLPSTKGALA